jgi:hypothetical protein
VTAPERLRPKEPDQWATNIPGRRPEFKTHRILAHAKNAINNFQGPLSRGVFTCDMILYKLVDGQYEPHLKIARGTRREDYPLLAPKPDPPSHKRAELGRLESSLRYHEKSVEELKAKIAALRKELGP